LTTDADGVRRQRAGPFITKGALSAGELLGLVLVGVVLDRGFHQRRLEKVEDLGVAELTAVRRGERRGDTRDARQGMEEIGDGRAAGVLIELLDLELELGLRRLVLVVAGFRARTKRIARRSAITSLSAENSRTTTTLTVRLRVLTPGTRCSTPTWLVASSRGSGHRSH
jgi:hypothetical protein